MSDVIINKLSVDVSAYEMPEEKKVDKLVKALSAEDLDTGVEMLSYGVYTVSSGGSYGIMF